MTENSRNTLGRYQILRELGRGAMGRVLLAEDPTIHRKVAIKTVALPPGLSPEQQKAMSSRFLQEAQAAGGIRHPNVVAIYDMGTADDGAPFIVMEFLSGMSLRAILSQRGRFPVGEAQAIIRQVLAGLGAAHSAGIIHRDVKPENIMVENDGRIILTDFGIAHLQRSDLTREGEVLGTPHYMSPEQIQGKGVDERSDLFSVGVIFHELLSGQKPFPGKNPTAVCFRIVQGQAEPLPSDIILPLPAARLLQGLMAKEADSRFSSAAAAMAQIDSGAIHTPTPLSGSPHPGQQATMALETPLPSSIQSPSTVLSPPPPSRGPRWLYMALGALGGMVLLGGACFAFLLMVGLFSDDRESPPSPKPNDTVLLEAPPDTTPETSDTTPKPTPPPKPKHKSPVATQKINVIFESRLTSGTLKFMIDGKVAWSTHLRPTSRSRGIKKTRLLHSFSAPVGTRRFRIEVNPPKGGTVGRTWTVALSPTGQGPLFKVEYRPLVRRLDFKRLN